MSGKFIVIEGSDGSGKSSVAENIHKAFAGSVLVNDPSKNSNLTLGIRNLVLSNLFDPHKITELLLYTACRAELIHKIILPSLLCDKMVICDRYIYSTYIYQGILGGFSREEIDYLHKQYCNNLFPDLLIFLDVSAEIGLKRSTKRLLENEIDETRWESKGLETFKKINEFYRVMIRCLDNNINKLCINSDKYDIEEMSEKSINKIQKLYNLS